MTKYNSHDCIHAGDLFTALTIQVQCQELLALKDNMSHLPHLDPELSFGRNKDSRKTQDLKTKRAR